MKGNGWKIALVIVLLCAAGYLAFRSIGRDAVDTFPSEFLYVCVETGELFDLPRGKTRVLPVPNPKTGRETLFPAERRGHEVFLAVDRNVLKVAGDLNKVVDLDTLQVRLPSP